MGAQPGPEHIAAAAFDDVPDPVWELHGPDLVVSAANAAARALTAADVVGEPLTAALPGADVAALWRLLRTGDPLVDVEWTLRLAGTSVPVAVHAVRVHGTDGQVRGLLVRARRLPAGADVVRLPTEPADDLGSVEHGPAEPLPPPHVPATVPILPGARLAAHWVPATLTTAAGDWFDVVPLAAGRVALATGDVVGRGDACAAGVATLRALLKDALLAGLPLADVLARVDRSAARSELTRGAAMTVAVVDPATGGVEHARCAHPPPLVCGTRGAVAELLTGDAGGPLGVGAPLPLPALARLDPGAALLLYTDSLLERDGQSVAARLPQLTRVGAGCWPPAEPDPAAGLDGLCARIVAQLCGPGPRDDVALLGLTRTVDATEALHLDVLARAPELRVLRERFTGWLEGLGATVESTTALPLAVSELVSNCIEHAYPPARPGPVRVDATLGAAGLTISVSDDGQWRPPGERRRRSAHYGLAVVRELCDSVVVTPGPQGTAVTVTYALGHPTVVHGRAARSQLGAVPDPVEFSVDTARSLPPVLTVRGPVDLPTVDELRTALLHATAGGTSPAVLDLSLATTFASVGVRLLHELERFADPPLRIVAPQGSVARSVLTMTGLGHLVVADR